MKPFQVLLIGAAVWGVTLALAFVGGLSIGSSGDDDATPAALASQEAGIGGPQGDLDQAAREALRKRVQSGEATQEEIDQLRQRFQQGGGQRGTGQGGWLDGPGAGGPGSTGPGGG